MDELSKLIAFLSGKIPFSASLDAYDAPEVITFKIFDGGKVSVFQNNNGNLTGVFHGLSAVDVIEMIGGSK